MVLVDGVGGGVTVLGCVGRVSGTIKEKAYLSKYVQR